MIDILKKEDVETLRKAFKTLGSKKHEYSIINVKGKVKIYNNNDQTQFRKILSIDFDKYFAINVAIINQLKGKTIAIHDNNNFESEGKFVLGNTRSPDREFERFFNKLIKVKVKKNNKTVVR